MLAASVVVRARWPLDRPQRTSSSLHVAPPHLAMTVTAPGRLEPVRREGLRPAHGEVLIRTSWCGVCASDKFTVHPSATDRRLTLPRVPGHEVIGTVVGRGGGVPHDELTTRDGAVVGVGWHGGHCGRCAACRHGDFLGCSSAPATGHSRDGGYAEFMVARAESLALVPPEVASANEASAMAPLLCAGVTVFNALRRATRHALPPAVVAIQGLGGLGHLAVQFARKLGHHTVALSRGGAEKEALARQLGAHHFINTSTAKDGGARALRDMGGAHLILATAPAATEMTALVRGLRFGGALLVAGADAQGQLAVSPAQLIDKRVTIEGVKVGTATDSEATLQFAALHSVRPMVEVFPLAEARRAYEHMASGRARFRVVLDCRFPQP